MGILETVSFKKVVKLLFAYGYFVHNQTGSHINFKKDGAVFIITIAKHDKHIPLYSVKSIMKRLNMSREQFLKELKKY
jgi:predicted RNA binding protein YcfA (HicA-like mRNA interferase family)